TYRCKECLFTLHSPIERKLYLELSKNYIPFKPQYGLNWYGKRIYTENKTYDDVKNNFKDVLTIVDFYIEKNERKLCVYTDGHTYHERTEEQAQRDRNIDRKLQELGFHVLRYTGKDVNENINSIISDIRKWIE
ncbi:MAG: endonuclease domain-containing protein, partial [Bacteroidota bacterium]